ncbi:MAG: Dyp-type peroxidase [Acidimicrobiia bacterium]|nr:Dyp-type peroxidase [Acidimicrobiia bacterium]
MPNPQHAILTDLAKYQWYTHLSRTEGADLGVIKDALRKARTAGEEVGVTTPVNVCLLFGPTLLADLTDDIPEDFQPYPGYESKDGKVAKATQEELLLWIHSDEKDLCWETQFRFRNAVAGHMNVARETPTFIYRNSLDLTGFIDGTGNPQPEHQHDKAIVPDGKPGAGGSFCIAQRWVHDLGYFEGLSLEDQENLFGRSKKDSTRLDKQVPTSHLSHVELRDGETADASKPKRGEMVRRSTPYAFHDGTVGLYFMGFCKEQAPMRERMEAIYGMNGQARDALTDYSTPASGSFYFAPSSETLDAALG